MHLNHLGGEGQEGRLKEPLALLRSSLFPELGDAAADLTEERDDLRRGRSQRGDAPSRMQVAPTHIGSLSLNQDLEDTQHPTLALQEL